MAYPPQPPNGPQGRYGPPPNQYGPPPQQPPKKKWLWIVGGVVAFGVVGAIACTDSAEQGFDETRDTVPVTSQVQTPAPVATAPVIPPASATSPAPKALPDNGILKVGTDIQPGEYSLSPTSSIGGYWERLSCLTGDFECIIANDNVQGDGYLTITPSDVAVKVQDLQLTPTTYPAQPTARRPGQSPVPLPPAFPVPPTGGNALAPTIPGTDGQGFAGIPEARCNFTNPAVAIGRTTESLVVICETGAGRLYYKGVRLNDGAAIEIDDPVRTETGFAATNQGVRYSLSRNALVITEGAAQLASEPTLNYWSN